MPKNVLTMPVRESSIYAHKYGVYSIQAHRDDMVESLCQDPNQYLALRESSDRRLGAMLWLYQVLSAPGLWLDPKKPLPDQIKQWHEGLRDNQPRLSAQQQARLSNYMKAVAKLGDDYQKGTAFLRAWAVAARQSRRKCTATWPVDAQATPRRKYPTTNNLLAGRHPHKTNTPKAASDRSLTPAPESRATTNQHPSNFSS